jgi:hypothetical protein
MVKDGLPFGFGGVTTAGARGPSHRLGSSILADVLGRRLW